MTECERLVNEGKIEPSFLEEEDREGYTVSSKMKKVWAISIDLYETLLQVCKKYDLRLMAIGGTAIGAVRHHGFIPWDDDLDFAMPREDYQTLIRVAEAEFSYPYFLQSPLTDPCFFNRFFIRLRNSNTTGISSFDHHAGCNNGIFIDIFPLDDYKKNLSCKMFINASKIKAMTAWNKVHYNQMNEKSAVRKLLYYASPLIIGTNIQKLYVKHEKQCVKRNQRNYPMMGIMYESFIGDPNRWAWPKACFDSITWMPFEYTQIPLAIGYDEMLRISFGDYMKYPPRETWGTYHSLEFEPDIGYIDFCAT